LSGLPSFSASPTKPVMRPTNVVGLAVDDIDRLVAAIGKIEAMLF